MTRKSYRKSCRRNDSQSGIKWAMPRYKQDWQHICAILPAYLDDGTNGTQITYTDGREETVHYRVPWVLDDLLEYLCSSRSVLTAQSKAYLGKYARRVPLIVPHQLTLVPVKGREEHAKGHGTVGYLVLEHIVDVRPSTKNENIVYFTNHAQVQVLDNTRVLWGNITLSESLKQTMESERTHTANHSPVVL